MVAAFQQLAPMPGRILRFPVALVVLASWCGAALAAELPAAPAQEPAPEEAVQDPEIRAIELGVVDAIRTCYDPEIPVNIYDLGLIYNVDVAPTKDVTVTMTLTSPMCPVAESLPPEVEDKVRSVYGVADAFAPGANYNDKAFMTKLKSLKPGDSVTIQFNTDFERHRILAMRKNNVQAKTEKPGTPAKVKN